VVVGGGGHAKVVLDVLHAEGWRVAGYTDPQAAAGDQIDGVSCLGTDAVLPELRASGVCRAIVALGDNELRDRVAGGVVALGFTLGNAVHPSAQISRSAVLGQGVAVMAGAVVNAGSVIGDNSVINTCASVDHDCRIGRSVHVAPGAHLAGYVTVEDLALIGVGSTIGRGRPLRLGERSVVGVGSVVIHDVAPGALVVGSPARPLRASASTRTTGKNRTWTT
jgi:UDP-perosamine 4-acetyltransferase